MKHLLWAQLLLLSPWAFSGDKPATCELAGNNIISRSSSGLAQVSNVGPIQITCSVPARPFPTQPGTSRMGLGVETATYKLSEDGSKELVPSEANETGVGGGGFRIAVGAEWVKFHVHIPLDSAELDAEADAFLAKMEQERAPKQLTEQERSKALERLHEFDYQHRVGHFLVECHVLDGDRVIGVGVVELEVLYKGRFSDLGLPGAPPV